MCPSLAMRSMSSSAVPPFALGDRDEVVVHVGHLHAGLIAHERHGEQRLEPARAAGDDRDRAGGRDGGDVAVAQQLHGTDALAPMHRARRWRRDPRCSAPTPGTRRARRRGARSPASPRRPGTRITLRPNSTPSGDVVRNAEAHERVGEAHHAKADPADALGERVDLGQRVLVDVDDVVEEVRRQMDVLRERVPVHRRRRSHSSRR